MKLFLIYLVASILVGCVDVYRATKQDEYLSDFPVGDIGEYVFPKPILGVHNYLFFPSWLVIGFVRFFNR